MIRSMTAFASGERQGPAGTLCCELRALEPALRERIASRVHRGKLDLAFRLRAPDGAGASWA